MTDADAKRAARDAWTVMASLVLDDERRHEISKAIGMPFSRVRALWRLAASPRTLSELAAALSIDPPNCIPIVDDLEKRGLVERRPHATDRRRKLLIVTTPGVRLANKARRIWNRPPPALLDLAPCDLQTLADILTRVKPVENPRAELAPGPSRPRQAPRV